MNPTRGAALVAVSLAQPAKPSNTIFVNGVPKLADIGLVADAEATRSYVSTEGFGRKARAHARPTSTPESRYCRKVLECVRPCGAFPQGSALVQSPRFLLHVVLALWNSAPRKYFHIS